MTNLDQFTMLVSGYLLKLLPMAIESRLSPQGLLNIGSQFKWREYNKVSKKTMASARMLLERSREYRGNDGELPIFVSTSIPYKEGQVEYKSISHARKPVRSERLTMSQDRTMIGNKRGFNFLSEISAKIESLQEDMKRRDEETKRQLKKLFILHDLKLRLYSVELVRDSSQGGNDKAAQEERNQIVHGANIEWSLEVLERMEKHDRDRLEAAEEGFKNRHGLSSIEGKSLIRAAPETIRFLNKKGDLAILHRYTRSKQKDKIETMKTVCNEIIDMWKNHVLSRDVPFPANKVEAKIAELDELDRRWEEEEGKEEGKGANDGHESRHQRRRR